MSGVGRRACMHEDRGRAHESGTGSWVGREANSASERNAR